MHYPYLSARCVYCYDIPDTYWKGYQSVLSIKLRLVQGHIPPYLKGYKFFIPYYRVLKN